MAALARPLAALAAAVAASTTATTTAAAVTPPRYWPRYGGARAVTTLDGDWATGQLGSIDQPPKNFDSMAPSFGPSSPEAATPNRTAVPACVDNTPPGYLGYRGVTFYRTTFDYDLASAPAVLQFQVGGWWVGWGCGIDRAVMPMVRSGVWVWLGGRAGGSGHGDVVCAVSSVSFRWLARQLPFAPRFLLLLRHAPWLSYSFAAPFVSSLVGVRQACSFYCRVWVNGMEVGDHRAGGYVAFALPVPSAAAASGGNSTSNELFVLADNRFNSTTAPMHTGGDFWHFGGIMRSVELHTLPSPTAVAPGGWPWRAYVLPTSLSSVNVTIQLTDHSYSGDVEVSLSFDGASQAEQEEQQRHQQQTATGKQEQVAAVSKQQQQLAASPTTTAMTLTTTATAVNGSVALGTVAVPKPTVWSTTNPQVRSLPCGFCCCFWRLSFCCQLASQMRVGDRPLEGLQKQWCDCSGGREIVRRRELAGGGGGGGGGGG
jgi:hypothetical protein